MEWCQAMPEIGGHDVFAWGITVTNKKYQVLGDYGKEHVVFWKEHVVFLGDSSRSLVMLP